MLERRYGMKRILKTCASICIFPCSMVLAIMSMISSKFDNWFYKDISEEWCD